MIHVGPPGKHDSAFSSPRFLLAVCLLAIGSAAEAFEDITVTSSSETVNFQQMQFTPSISSPPQPSQFDPTTGLLITAGYPFPVLGNVVVPGPQTYTYPSDAPADFLNNLTTANAGGLTPTLPDFGASRVSASASANLNRGVNALNTQYGLAFNGQGKINGLPAPGTFLQSPSYSPSTASVTLVSLSASFSTGGSPLPAVVGAFLNASGILGEAPGSFVEVGVKGDFDIDKGAAMGGKTDPFTWVGGYGYDMKGFPYSLSSGLTISAPDNMGSFTITGSKSFGIQQVNSEFVAKATLTLIADPGSLIQLGGASASLPGPPPNIGIIIGSPVPEPSSVVELATALIFALGVLGWKQRARTSARLKNLS